MHYALMSYLIEIIYETKIRIDGGAICGTTVPTANLSFPKANNGQFHKNTIKTGRYKKYF
jgi:hypothetical protein